MPTRKHSSPAAGSSAPEQLAGIGSDAVQKATGRTWPEWIALLDRENATNLPHKEIAGLLQTTYQLPTWWCQTVTVGYEQARGRRVVGQRCDGEFSASASKTLSLSAADAHAWFADAKKRTRWLDAGIVLRTATAPKSARLGFPDDTIAGAWITPKGDAKCSVGINHEKLADAPTAERYKRFWKAALERLAEIAT
jgi:hypothetical protein